MNSSPEKFPAIGWEYHVVLVRKFDGAKITVGETLSSLSAAEEDLDWFERWRADRGVHHIERRPIGEWTENAI